MNRRFSAPRAPWRAVLLSLMVLALAAASCGGGGGGGGGSDGGFTTADYQFLYTYNAVQLDGHTIRWSNLPISVSSTISGTQDAFNRWNTASSGAVRFTFSGGSNVTVAWTSSTAFCGLTTISWNSAGQITTASVLIARSQSGCAGGTGDTIAHEAGHAIGFLGHDASGLMNPFGGQPISDQESRFMRLLYSLSPGTDIRGFLKMRANAASSKYDPTGRRSYSMTIHKGE